MGMNPVDMGSVGFSMITGASVQPNAPSSTMVRKEGSWGLGLALRTIMFLLQFLIQSHRQKFRVDSIDFHARKTRKILPLVK